MILEKWLENHDIKKMFIEDFKIYLSEYEKEDSDKLLRDRDFEKLEFEFQWVSYVIETYHNDDKEKCKYIEAQVELEYEDDSLARYGANYDFDGKKINDYFEIS